MKFNEIIESRFIIILMNTEVPFYIESLHHGGEPCFTSYIAKADKYKVRSLAELDLKRVQESGFNMPLEIQPLEVSYRIG